MIRASLEDVVIEPQRQALIPGFQEVRRAALHAGALGCSISGAGPTMFAWSPSANADAVLDAMSRQFAQRSIQIDKWITEVQPDGGARVVQD
jgi:homoserine kinase